MARLKNQEDLVLYHDPHFYAAFPSLCHIAETTRPKSTAGEFLLAFRRARDFRWLTGEKITPADPTFSDVDHLDSRSEIVTLTLDANLKIINQPRSLAADPEAADQDANLIKLRNNRLLQYGFLWYPITPDYLPRLVKWQSRVFGSPEDTGVVYLPWGCYSRASDDGGRSWQRRRLFPPIPGAPDVVPGHRPLRGGALRGQAVELDNGDLLAASYFSLPKNRNKSTGHIYRSRDGGESWAFVNHLMLPTPDNIDLVEPALLHWPNGKISAFCRTAGVDDRLITLTSSDQGQSWQNYHVHDVTGHPYHPLKLRDGRVFLVYGYRHKPYGIRARILSPTMTDFGAAPEYIIRDDGLSRDLGYPWALELDDGRILVAYYLAGADGIRHIAASVFPLPK